MTTVLHVVSGLGLGGAERMLVEIATALEKSGLPQHVVSLRGEGAYGEVLRARGIPVTALDIGSPFETVGALSRLRQLVVELRPDVIQGWMYHGDLAAAFAHGFAAGRNKRRLYWNLRASNMDSERYGHILRWCAWLSRWPDAIVANSYAGASFHILQGYRPRRLELVANGIDTDRFRPDRALRALVRSELGIPDEAVLAIHIARVDPMKDHAAFLASMASIPHVHGLMVGAGTERLECPSNVQAIGVRRDVARYYACADIVVSTSAFGEGFSNAIAEGMSSGLIPVVTDVGDSRLIVGETGSVVEPGDWKALAEAIANEAAAPAALRQERGLAARARILKQFPLSRAVESFTRLYASA